MLSRALLTDRDRRRFFDRIALPDPETGCMEWRGSFGTDGYGKLSLKCSDGAHRNTGAHRVALFLSTGEAPDDAQAAHACGNQKCVAPAHLRWASASENQADRAQHGTDYYPGRRLTRSDVKALVAASADLGPRDLAAKFGVHVTTVRSILSGRSWSRVTRIGR